MDTIEEDLNGLHLRKLEKRRHDFFQGYLRLYTIAIYNV